MDRASVSPKPIVSPAFTPSRIINDLAGVQRYTFVVFRQLSGIVGYSFGYNWVQQNGGPSGIPTRDLRVRSASLYASELSALSNEIIISFGSIPDVPEDIRPGKFSLTGPAQAAAVDKA